MLPEPCDTNGCTCHWSPEHKSYFYDCQKLGLTEIPRSMPNETQCLIFSGNNITRGCADLSFLTNAYHLELQNNFISELCVNMIENYSYVDISTNRISELPKSIKHVSKMSLKLGNNPYECDCDILWMSAWLINVTTSSSTTVIIDGADVKCETGKNRGQLIKTLTDENLDCLQLPIVVIVVSCLIVITIVIVIFLIFRHYDTIKFFFFLKYNIRVNEDQVEDVDAMEFDALIAYRSVTLKEKSQHFHFGHLHHQSLHPMILMKE